MIVVKIELWPTGFKAKKREIGRMHIINVGEPRLNRGDYDVRVMRRGTIDRVQRTGHVEDYPRQSYTVWELVRRALNNVYG